MKRKKKVKTKPEAEAPAAVKETKNGPVVPVDVAAAMKMAKIPDMAELKDQYGRRKGKF